MQKIETFKQYKEITLDAAADFNEKEYKKALDKFLKLAETNPNNPKIHELLMFIYLRLEKYEKAEQEYQLCINLLKEELPKKYFKKRKNFKTLVKEAGKKETLEKECETIFKNKDNLNPYTAVEAASKLGTIYMAEGDYEKAEKILLEFKEKFLQAVAT